MPGSRKTNFNNVADVKFCIRGLDPKFVARYAVDMTMKGKMIITPGFEMKAVSFSDILHPKNFSQEFLIMCR